MLDPLTGAVCTPPQIWQMADEMLIAEEKWLPQYADAIAKAKIRMEEGRKNGTLLPTREGYQGAARLHTKLSLIHIWSDPAWRLYIAVRSVSAAAASSMTISFRRAASD